MAFGMERRPRLHGSQKDPSLKLLRSASSPVLAGSLPWCKPGLYERSDPRGALCGMHIRLQALHLDVLLGGKTWCHQNQLVQRRDQIEGWCW